MGGVIGTAATVVVAVCVEVRPVGSVTLRVAVCVPGVLNACVTVAPVALAPSSKDHA